MRQDPQDQPGNLVRVELQLEGEVRFGMAGLRDLGRDWHSHRKDDHARAVVLIHFLPHDNGLCSLCGDA